MDNTQDIKYIRPEQVQVFDLYDELLNANMDFDAHLVPSLDASRFIIEPAILDQVISVQGVRDEDRQKVIDDLLERGMLGNYGKESNPMYHLTHKGLAYYHGMKE